MVVVSARVTGDTTTPKTAVNGCFRLLNNCRSGKERKILSADRWRAGRARAMRDARSTRAHLRAERTACCLSSKVVVSALRAKVVSIVLEIRRSLTDLVTLFFRLVSAFGHKRRNVRRSVTNK